MRAFDTWFADQSVRTKILLGYGAILTFMVLIWVVVWVSTSLIGSIEDESARAEELQAVSDDIGSALADRTAAFQQFLLSGQLSVLDTYREADARFEAALDSARVLVENSTQRARLDSIALLSESWEDEVAEVGIPLRRATLEPDGPPVDTVIEFVQSGVGARGAQRAHMVVQRFQRAQDAIADERRSTLDLAVRRIRWGTTAFTIIAALVSWLIAVRTARRIADPLRRAVEFAGGVAAGDLTRELPVRGEDEVGALTATLNRMAADLRATIGRVNQATVQAATAAEQIAATSQQISRTVDEQVRSTEDTSSSMEQIAAQIARVAQSAESLAASVDQTSSSIAQMSQSIDQTAEHAEGLGSSVEQTSATIEEMAASITQVGRNVEETREIARAAQRDARSGGEVVSQSTDGMRRIHREMTALMETIRGLGSTGESIGRIIEVIEDIADQTNLLALNAAIEAARAGEHGRGFAVVAQEIRRLAERSVESTREIAATIRSVRSDVENAVRSSNSVAERTEEGIGLAEAAAEALDKIINSSARTRDLMEEVALATEQQTTAAEQAQQATRHIQQIAEETRIATREQAQGTRQIVQAVENMNRQTQEVFSATAEQKRGGDLILESTEIISQGARATQAAVQEVVAAARDLSVQAAELTELVNDFTV